MGRRFWLANGAILLDEVLYLALIPLLPHYADRFNLTKAETGLLYAAYPLMLVLASIPGGLVADRVGVRKVLVVGCALLVGATVGFAFAATAWQLWLMRALQGLTAGLVASAGMATIAAGAKVDRRATTIAIAVSLQGLSAVAGYVLGGFVSPAIGTRATFLITAAVGVAICLAFVFDRTPDPPPGLMPLRQLLGGALASTAVRASVACILVVGLIGSSVQTLGSIELGAAGYSVSNLGTVFVIAACLGFVSTPIAGRIADRYGVVAAITVWAFATPFVVLGFAVPTARPWVMASLLALVLPLTRIGGSLSYARGAQYARLGEGLAASYGLALTAWSVGAAAGPVIAGTIADASGDELAFVAIGLIALLLAIPASRRDPSLEPVTS